jgi:hypothetical protein
MALIDCGICVSSAAATLALYSSTLEFGIVRAG